MIKDKGKNYLESNVVVYSSFKDWEEVVFSNQVLVTKGNVDNVALNLNKLVKEDNKGVMKEGFYSNKNTIENGFINKIDQTCLGCENKKKSVVDNKNKEKGVDS